MKKGNRFGGKYKLDTFASKNKTNDSNSLQIKAVIKMSLFNGDEYRIK